MSIAPLTSFGIIPDGRTLCTVGLQAAIDQLHLAGGGTLTIPAGRYLTGTLQLKENVHLVLEAGAELLGSRCLTDYATDTPGCIEAPSFNRSLIYAYRAKHIGIHGPGIINGQGDKEAFPPSSDPAYVPERPMLIRFTECSDIEITGVHLCNAASWCCHMVNCTGIAITDTRLDSRLNRNNDGFDLDGCRDVSIRNCHITSGDDAICLKSTGSHPAENIFVSGCVVSSETAGVKLGTSSAGGFRNVQVDQCVFRDCRMGVLKLLCVDGGTMENIDFSNLVMENVEGPIFLRLGRRGVVFDRPKEIVYDLGDVKEAIPAEGSLRNCSFRNICATVTTHDKARAGILLTGVPGNPIRNVVLEKITITLPGGGTKEDAALVVAEDERRYPEQFFFGTLPSSVLYLRHVDGVVVRDLHATLTDPDARPAVALLDAAQVQFERSGVRASPESVEEPLFP